MLSEGGLQITMEQWPILIHLWDRNGQTQKELANRVFKDKTTITRLVADIESSGIIERQPDREDKRERSVFLTEKGKEIMNMATMLIQRVDGCAEAGIDEKDLMICKTVLRRLHRNLTESSL